MANKVVPELTRILKLLMVSALVALASTSAMAQGGLRPAGPNDANIFLPELQQALTVELHFVNKVCQPTEEQFRRIQRHGMESVPDIAQRYLYLQRERRSPETWPGPNEAIAGELQEAVNRVMPEDVANNYRAEIVARFDAANAADAAVIVNLVDQQTILAPGQQEKLYQSLRKDWNPQWSKGNVVLLYPQYARLPDDELLARHLTPHQQQLWSYRPERRDVRLSWEVYLGTGDLLDAARLEPMDPPKQGAAGEETK